MIFKMASSCLLFYKLSDTPNQGDFGVQKIFFGILVDTCVYYFDLRDIWLITFFKVTKNIWLGMYFVQFYRVLNLVDIYWGDS